MQADFKQKFIDLITGSVLENAEAIRHFENRVRLNDALTSQLLLTTMQNLITRQSKNEAKTRCLDVDHILCPSVSHIWLI